MKSSTRTLVLFEQLLLTDFADSIWSTTTFNSIRLDSIWFDRSQRSLPAVSSLLQMNLGRWRIGFFERVQKRTRVILVLDQRLSAVDYTHDVNTCSDAGGPLSVACTHTFTFTTQHLSYWLRTHMHPRLTYVYTPWWNETKRDTVWCARAPGDSMVFEKQSTRCGKESSRFLLALGLPGALRLKLNRSNLLPRGPSHCRPS